MSVNQDEALQLAVKRGIFIIKNLAVLNFDDLLQKIECIANQNDKKTWYHSAEQLCIDLNALHVLDNTNPPISYSYYFCTPDILSKWPKLIGYYRNVAMISQNEMSDMGLKTTSYEIGAVPPSDIAQKLACQFNKTVSALLKVGYITSRSHLEMAFVSLGSSFGDLWRSKES